MNRDWQLFKRCELKSLSMTVAIYKSGHLSLTQEVCRKLGTDMVHLLFNEKTGEIGIKPAKNEDPHIFKLQKRPRQTSQIINANSFIKHYKLNHLRQGRYNVVFNDGVLVIDTTKRVLR